MKTFFNSFWNFVFCLKFHIQQFHPNENFKNSVPSYFLLPLILKNFSFPKILLSSKIQYPPFGSCYVWALVVSIYVLLYVYTILQ